MYLLVETEKKEQIRSTKMRNISSISKAHILLTPWDPGLTLGRVSCQRKTKKQIQQGESNPIKK